MDLQTTSQILMIRPVNFGYNSETAVNNAFQVAGITGNIQQRALEEFETFAALLIANNINLVIVNDTPYPHTPDSIFPNNWISFHAGGDICLYPMFALNRRLERKPAIIETISRQFIIRQTFDFSAREKDHRFLEGTGSMTLDRTNRIAYAVISPRTDHRVLNEFCETMNFTPHAFHAVDEQRNPIYHTNVMMCIAEEIAVICLDSIPDKEEKKNIIRALAHSGKEIISITFDQMNHFAGNMLQVRDNRNNKYMVMSEQAFQSLDIPQAKIIERNNRIIAAQLNTIESNGGGSARCMMAEIFLPLR